MKNKITEQELNALKRLKEEQYSDHEHEFLSAIHGIGHNKGVSYWDYINIESLLSLQQPLTKFPDEMIFITYHQITELYFKLIRWELEHLIFNKIKKDHKDYPEYIFPNNWMKRIGRIINYYDQLKYSFKTLMPGEKNSRKQYFDSKEFGQFRLSLSPASGFQTISFRKLELLSTSMNNLVSVEKRSDFYHESDAVKLYNYLYWREGGQFFDKESDSYKPSKTLRNFEEKYKKEIIQFAESHKIHNLEYLFFKYHPEDLEEHDRLEEIRENQEIIKLLKDYDRFVNKDWKMHHFKSIEAHMPKESHGTGGTNWRKFLNPDNQQLNYFPQLKK